MMKFWEPMPNISVPHDHSVGIRSGAMTTARYHPLSLQLFHRFFKCPRDDGKSAIGQGDVASWKRTGI